MAFLYRQLSNQCEVTPHFSHFEKEDSLHVIYSIEYETSSFKDYTRATFQTAT